MFTKISRAFIKLLERIHYLRERLIWLPLSADETEENLYYELCSYIKEYESIILNQSFDTN